MATLDYCDEYEAFVVDSKTQETLFALPWSNINWQRIYSEISIASVNVANADKGMECFGLVGGFRPWQQMLRIERNGTAVWDGPLTGWNRPRGSRNVTIRAHDRSILTQKRLIRVHRSFSAVTPYSVIRQVMLDALMTQITYDPYPLTINVATPPTESVTREYFTERLERVYDVMVELNNNTSSGFWTTALDTIYLDELQIADLLGRANTGKAPKLSEMTTIGLPGIDVDGLGMCTYAYAGGAGQGTNGFPSISTNSGNLNIFLTSVLEKASAEDRSVTDLALVAGRLAAESLAPGVTLEQIQLSPLFGSEFMNADLSNLLPGAQFDVDFAETSAFNVPVSEYREAVGVPGVAYMTAVTRARLEQLDVSVGKTDGGGISEEVYGSFRSFITAVPTDSSGAVATPDVSGTSFTGDGGTVTPPAGGGDYYRGQRTSDWPH